MWCLTEMRENNIVIINGSNWENLSRKSKAELGSPRVQNKRQLHMPPVPNFCSLTPNWLKETVREWQSECHSLTDWINVCLAVRIFDWLTECLSRCMLDQMSDWLLESLKSYWPNSWPIARVNVWLHDRLTEGINDCLSDLLAECVDV